MIRIDLYCYILISHNASVLIVNNQSLLIFFKKEEDSITN